MMADIRAVLFDKDGTLVDVMKTWFPVYVDMLRTFDGTDDETIRSALVAGGYLPDEHNFQPGSMLAAGTPDQMVDIWWPHLRGVAREERIIAADQFCTDKSLEYVCELIALGPFLNELRDNGFSIGIGTNDNATSASQQMMQLGVHGCFDHILGFDSVVNPKPAGDMVHAFCRLTDMQPINIAVVGDNSHDMLMARDAGAGLAIGVLSGNSAREDLEPLADIVIDDVSHLMSQLVSTDAGATPN